MANFNMTSTTIFREVIFIVVKSLILKNLASSHLLGEVVMLVCAVASVNRWCSEILLFGDEVQLKPNEISLTE